MSNLYSFVSRKATAPKAEDIAKAEMVSSVDDFISVAHKAEEYQFTDKGASAELIQSVMKSAVSVRIWSEKLDNGNNVTKGEATLENGAIVPFRTFGKKGEVVNETTIEGDALKSLIWGVCTQGGEVRTETKHLNGVCRKFPVPYLRIA